MASAWSEWKWSDKYQCYTQWRFNERGEEEWDYRKSPEEVENLGNTLYSQPTAESSQRAQSQYQYEGGNGKEAADDNTAEKFASMTLNSYSLQNLGPSYSSQRSDYVQSGSGPPAQSSRGNITNYGTGYKKCKSKDFKFGKVFKVLWSEPRGSNGTNITSMGSQGDTFQKVRRFVIVKNFEGHCLCLPILTYEGRGTLKPGVKANDHAVIYTDKAVGPLCLENEVLDKLPIRMEPADASHKLHLASRVNYAKVYTVEHNVKVLFIGTLPRNSQAQLSFDYNLQHPPIDQIEPEAGYSMGPSGFNSGSGSNEDQQYQQMSTTADEYYTNPGSSLAGSNYTVPLPRKDLGYYHQTGSSVSESDRSPGYTHERQTAGNNYPDQDQYGIQGEQGDADRTPRRAVSPEHNPLPPTILNEETGDFPM
ncbi:hypothetical protein ACEPPN_010311 [Leptodophora sp. 'Broadleaf-Isolate-01']